MGNRGRSRGEILRKDFLEPLGVTQNPGLTTVSAATRCAGLPAGPEL
ncbi:hypothetical protein Pd630_LPD03735 [Rhodococcus opacus PD630]|nr:hypothetical protein Pd630_LPD03735 [Rhodococcus opacus PD630]